MKLTNLRNGNKTDKQVTEIIIEMHRSCGNLKGYKNCST